MVRGLKALREGARELRMTFGAKHRVLVQIEELLRQVELSRSGLGGFVT